jgi:hypothetical protein
MADYRRQYPDGSEDADEDARGRSLLGELHRAAVVVEMTGSKDARVGAVSLYKLARTTGANSRLEWLTEAFIDMAGAEITSRARLWRSYRRHRGYRRVTKYEAAAGLDSQDDF